MAGITFNPKPQRRVPINRNNLFYSEEDYLFEMDLGKNYIEQDMGQTVVLYQVNMSETQIDAVYGETKPNAMRFLPPIEVPCVYEIANPELKSYDKSKNLATYLKTGKLTVGVYQASLDELGVDIKKGDILMVQVTPTHGEYFTVANDGRNNYDNAHTMYGTVPLYRTIIAYPTDRSEIFGA